MKWTSLLASFAIGAVLTGAIASARGNGAVNSSALLAELNKGNERFTSGKNAFPRSGATRRKDVAKGQTPFATVLTCADSRVSPEFIFDQGIGDLFVVRVAGNVADTDEIGTIEYGVGHLKTPVLIVMGHTHCGAVKAVQEGAKVSQNIKWLVDNIAPALDRVKKSHPDADAHEIVELAVEENVRQSIQDILKRSEEVREKVAEGHLTICGGVYDLESGKVKWLGAKPEIHAETPSSSDWGQEPK
jgi:carbonic anhydrase